MQVLYWKSNFPTRQNIKPSQSAEHLGFIKTKKMQKQKMICLVSSLSHASPLFEKVRAVKIVVITNNEQLKYGLPLHAVYLI